MTQRDRWKRRPVIERYHVFRDLVRASGVQIPESGAHVTFVVAMPSSWSALKRAAHDGKPHRQRPDLDNMVKALLDAIYTEDCQVHDLRASKIWGQGGMIVVT